MLDGASVTIVLRLEKPSLLQPMNPPAGMADAIQLVYAGQQMQLDFDFVQLVSLYQSQWHSYSVRCLHGCVLVGRLNRMAYGDHRHLYHLLLMLM